MFKVSNKEILDSLKISLKKNTDAIDYIERELNKVKDILVYNRDDVVAKDDLVCLEYIKFSLSYLDKQYMKSFKQLGGKL